jgi:hypothetical protein
VLELLFELSIVVERTEEQGRKRAFMASEDTFRPSRHKWESHLTDWPAPPGKRSLWKKEDNIIVFRELLNFIFIFLILPLIFLEYLLIYFFWLEKKILFKKLENHLECPESCLDRVSCLWSSSTFFLVACGPTEVVPDVAVRSPAEHHHQRVGQTTRM